MRVLIVADIGNTGGYHVGDEAMATANCDWWREVEPTVTLTKSSGVRLALDALKRCDLVHLAGGGNLCDRFGALRDSRRALLRQCHAAGVPVVVTGQTLGPGGELPELAACRYVGVRDPDWSIEYAARHGDAVARHCVDDATFLREEQVAGLASAELGISIHRRSGSPLTLRQLGERVGELVQRVGKVVSVPHHPSDAGFARAAGVPALLPVLEDRVAKWATSRCGLFLSTRYHGAVFAAAAAVPSFGLFQDDHSEIKMRGLYASLELPGWLARPVTELSSGLYRELSERRVEIHKLLVDAQPRARLLYAAERAELLRAVGR